MKPFQHDYARQKQQQQSDRLDMMHAYTCNKNNAPKIKDIYVMKRY